MADHQSTFVNRPQQLFLLGLGFWVLALMISLGWDQMALLAFGEDTWGMILDVKQPPTGGIRPSDFTYRFRFADRDGRWHEGTDTVAPAKPWPREGAVLVRFVPWLPSASRLAGNVSTTPLFGLLMGLLLAGTSAWNLWRIWKLEKELRREDSIREGEVLCRYAARSDLETLRYELYSDRLIVRMFGFCADVPLVGLETPAAMRRERAPLFWYGLGFAAFVVLLHGVGLVCSGEWFASWLSGFDVLFFAGVWLAAKYARKEGWAAIQDKEGMEVLAIPLSGEGFTSFVERLESQISSAG